MTNEIQKAVSLDEFIFETVKEYIDGVKRAQEYAKTRSASVSPVISGKFENFSPYRLDTPEQRYGMATNIEFEVLVTSSHESAAGADLGVRVHVFQAGVKGDLKDSVSQASKIRFSIPVGLPPQE